MSELPKGWAEVALGDVAEINPTPATKPKPDDAISFIPMADLDANAGQTSLGTTRPFHEVAKGYRTFRRNDLLVAKITPCFQNNKIGQAQIRHAVGVGSTEFHVVRPFEGFINRRYLLHFLRLDNVRVEGERRMTGSGGQRRVPPEFIKQLRIPLPPLDEQGRIAAILDKNDENNDKQAQRIELFKRLRAATVLQFLSDRSEPPEPLGDHLDFLTSGSRGWAKYYSDSGPAFLRIQNVANGKINFNDLARVEPPSTAEAKRTRAMPGDVLLSITADLGRTAVIPDGLGPAHINQHLAILRSSTLIPEYLSAFIEAPSGRRQLIKKNRGQTKAGLNFSDVRSLSIPVPPRREQERLASQLNGITLLATKLSSQLEAQKLLTRSLQSRAFRGEL